MTAFISHIFLDRLLRFFFFFSWFADTLGCQNVLGIAAFCLEAEIEHSVKRVLS